LLGEDGIVVDVQPMKAAKTLGDCRAVVLGAPLQRLGWHKDALAFLDRHRPALARLATAVFALGPSYDEEERWQEVRAQLESEFAKFPWFTPVAVEVFAANTLGLRWRTIPALKNMPASDVRDWAAVESWASTLPEKLQLGGA